MSGAPDAISCDFSLLERNVSSKNAQLNLHNSSSLEKEVNRDATWAGRRIGHAASQNLRAWNFSIWAVTPVTAESLLGNRFVVAFGTATARTTFVRRRARARRAEG